MSARRSITSGCYSFAVAITLVLLHATTLHAQAPSPWSGIAADEARPATGQMSFYGTNDVAAKSLSADARFVVFNSNLPHLVPGDTDNWSDVFLRDRQTGELTRISVAADGTPANHYSSNATISANGRHVAFYSCATNLVAADTNGTCDLFVRDLELGTTTLAGVGPNGEQATYTGWHQFRLSADGRYVVFSARFAAGARFAWLRDRDADANGVFDEPGSSTTTPINETVVGSNQLGSVEDVAISGDGRWIAYVAVTTDSVYNYLGFRLYLHDRLGVTTVRVDQPMAGSSDTVAYTWAPDFSDAGHLAYASNADNLVEGDTDWNDDVFIFHVLTGGTTAVQLNHPDAPTLDYEWAPAISADGRYVSFMGAEYTQYDYFYNVYAVDRQTGLSYEISVRPDGARDNTTSGPSISADGSAIAFAAGPETLVFGWGNRGVFVATDIALSPSEIDVPEAGGTFSIDVTAPADTPWTLQTIYAWNAEFSQTSGVGPATVEITIQVNDSGEDREHLVILGSEHVTLHQTTAPIVAFVGPYSGPPTGGTEVQIGGHAFADGATVTFGGTPATNVVFVSNETIMATTPAHLPAGPVTVVVTNPSGASGELEYGFYYMDDTPPVITSEITGTLGQNGWYTSEVIVSWTVEDAESEIFNETCYTITVSADTASEFVWCSAASEGGDSQAQVDVKRDTTPPVVAILVPEPRTYFQGEQVAFYHNCSDATSGIATCTASQPGAHLDTSVIGTFEISATAVDLAGHATTSTEPYTVKMATAITVPGVTVVYGTTASLRATLLGSGAPLAGKTIAFTIDNTFVGAESTSGSGEAVLDLPPVGRNAGSYLIGAQFIGDDSSFAATNIGPLEIEKASPVLTWTAPSPIAHGTALGAAQLNATATVPGTFEYSPEAGTVLDPGTHTLSAIFTPQDAANYNTALKTVTLKVKAVPILTWATPAPVRYPAFSSAHLNATANVAGTFVYNPPWNTLLPAGTHTLSVTFTPFNAADYATATAGVMLEVLKGTPTIAWDYVDPIIYGTPLSAAQLKATSPSTSGTFTYTPAAGTVLPAGTQTLSVLFTPAEPGNYETATATKSLLVGQASPPVSWTNPAPIAYGTPLGATQFNATSTLAGTFIYTPQAGTVLNAGTRQLSASFFPADGANYQSVTHYKTIVVQQIATTVTWANPASITYGTSLAWAQLNATAGVPGSFYYNPIVGTQLAAGSHSLYVNFIPTDSVNYASSNKYVSIVVAKRTPVITWNNPAPIVYGTPLGWTQYNPTVNVGGGSFERTPPIGTVLNAGAGQTLTVTYYPSDSFNYNSASASVTIDVLKATPTLTWGYPPAIPYGTPLGAAHLFAAANRPGTFAYSPGAGTVLPAGPHTLSATFTPDDPNYAVTSITTPLNVYKATPVVTWPAPAAITYGTPLSATQLNATANTAGTFSYSPPAGTVLDGGTRTLWLTFTASDQSNYSSVGAINVPIEVSRAIPIVTWPAPAAIVHGTALSAVQLNATANTPGSFAYTPATGSVLAAGTQTLSVTFTPTYSNNYTTATAGVSIEVTKAAPIVTWPDPAGINYGTALGTAQLNATANVPGTFEYSPAAGTVLTAGTQPLSGIFTPNDSLNYTTATVGASIVVAKTAPIVSWSDPAGISYGTALSATQLAATANVPGTFAYSPAEGVVPNAGTQPLSVTFTPNDSVNYTTATAGASIVVAKATPIVTWSDPAGITFGTALSSAQLNATANVSGTFVYSPAAGTVLGAGTQPLSVSFTPTDAGNYTTATAGVSIVVGKVAPVVSWTNPAGITYGTALSATQLAATANVPGTFAYSPAAGAVLNAGTQPLSVIFTPTDSANYTTAAEGVSILIARATPIITWTNPAGINYGTALSAAQLSATANVSGTFAYSPAAGTVLAAGNNALAVTFTPADAVNYNPQSANRSIAVAKIGLTVQTVNTSKVYRQALPAFTVSGTGFVNGDTVASLGGTLSFATSATATSAPGSYVVTPSGATSANYNITFTSGTLTVTKANTAVVLTTTPSPSVNNQSVQLRAVVSAVAPGAGTATGTVQFRDNGVLLGTAQLVNGVATINKSFKRGSRPLTATYVGNTNFNGSSGAKTHQVN